MYVSFCKVAQFLLILHRFKELVIMKRIVYSVALALALLSVGCSETGKNSSVLPQIDMNADYPKKEIILQDIAEISYIPLETTNEILFEGSIVEFSENGIVVEDISNDRMLLFYPDGKARSLFKRKGESGQEYTSLHDGVVDWKRKEIFVSHKGGEEIQVYTLEGEHKRTLKINGMMMSSQSLCHFDDDHLLAFKRTPILGGNKPVEPYRPLLLISKENGSVDSLAYQKDYLASLRITGLSAQAYISLPEFQNSGSLTFMTDMGADTIYTIQKDGRLSPYLTRTPSVTSDKEGKFFLMLAGVSGRYDFLTRQAKQLVLGSDYVARDEITHSLVLDRKTGEIFEPEYKNSECPSLDVEPRFVAGYDNCACYYWEAFDLIEALQAGELSGELKTIAEGLKEDDNPVLMVLKFKE